MLKLNKISLEGYKSIRQCRDLALSNLNVLIGANGSGKSNFLSFFKLLNFEMTGALQEFIGRSGGPESLLHFGTKTTPHITAALEILSDKGVNTYRMRLAHAAPDSLIFTEESLHYRAYDAPANPPTKHLGAGHRETVLRSPEMANNSTAKFFRETLPLFRFYQFHDTSDEARLRGRSGINDNRVFYHNGGNLPALLRVIRERHPTNYQQIVETIRLVFPLFRDFILEPERNGEEYLLLRWKAVGAAEYDFGPHQLSDGTLRFIALVALLLQPKSWLPRLITIDEPELGLHPYAIKILASLLQDASNFTQIIVATQSSALVDSVEPKDVIIANSEAGASRFERPDGEKLKAWLKDYSLSEVWEMNLIGGRP